MLIPLPILTLVSIAPCATSLRLHYEVIGDIGLPCLLVKRQNVIMCAGRYPTASVDLGRLLKRVLRLAPEVSDQMRSNSHAAPANMVVYLFLVSNLRPI